LTLTAGTARRHPSGNGTTCEETDVRPVRRPPALRLAPEPDLDPFALDDDEGPGADAAEAPPAADRRYSSTAVEDLARACWPMHLYAVLGDEVGRAVEADVLSHAQAEFLLARLTVVIDQALGVDKR
jgi:hypothetical protein